MQIEVFTDQFDLAAPLYDMSPEELRRRDLSNTSPPQRWLAIRSGKAVGAATARLRPDNRMFIDFECVELSAYAPLTEAASEALDQRLYTTIDEEDRPALVALRATGFDADFVGERFRIGFDAALQRLRRAWIPSGLSIQSARGLDERPLFTLDNAIRDDVPGTDGWRGDRDWFHGELTESPPFDPAAYLVAIDEHNGEYIGLVRIWRNPEGPRLGLVGVLRQYRNMPIAAALLKQALVAASGWGHNTFTTETAPSNTLIYRRMQRIEAESLGRFLRLVRR